MTKRAILLSEGNAASEQSRIAGILDFFGVSWETARAATFWDMHHEDQNSVVFGSVRAVSAVLALAQNAESFGAQNLTFYAYAGADRRESERALQTLTGSDDIFLREAPGRTLSLSVSRDHPELTGPMGGLEISSQLRPEDSILVGGLDAKSALTSIIAAEGAPVFVRFQVNGVAIFLNASSHLLDIDQAVGPAYYDVKEHFCSVVPLVMFIRHMFRNSAWQPQELGACLIIDDPLLRQRYGSCDFRTLRDLMHRYGFTTNIAFIPWNWRRTSHSDAKFFKQEQGAFSVSIHGCNHTAGEFGETSPLVLNNRAKLAQSRMKKHEARTGVHHDSVMVFPQGVFSSASTEALKRNGYVAAVNTELVPVDSDGARTRIRDAWDVAIMRYGDFPIFTRRYAHHGLENFAFDLLLGKPCLIVAHHDFFSDDCERLVDLIKKLQSLPCTLRWRPLGEVIRRACRRRFRESDICEIEMYGSELLVENSLDKTARVQVWKRENGADFVTDVRCDLEPIRWTRDADHLFYEAEVGPSSEKHFQILYSEPSEVGRPKQSIRFELSVAIRRVLSELRDEYLSKKRFLSSTAANIK